MEVHDDVIYHNMTGKMVLASVLGAVSRQCREGRNNGAHLVARQPHHPTKVQATPAEKHQKHMIHQWILVYHSSR